MSKCINFLWVLIFLSASAHAMDTDVSLGDQLLAAAASVNQEVVKRLLDAKAPVDYGARNTGYTALFIAMFKKSPKMMRLLIDAGACVDYLDNYGNTLLGEAVMQQDLECVQLLLEAKASVDGTVAINTAALFGPAKMVHKLIDARASIDCVDDAGLTPLMQIVKYGSPRRVRMLIEEMLRIPNEEQKRKMCLFFGYAKKYGTKYGFNKSFLRSLKPFMLAKVSEQNRENFRQSIAYREVVKLGDGPAKKAILEKYDRNEKTKSGCGIQ